MPHPYTEAAIELSNHITKFAHDWIRVNGYKTDMIAVVAVKLLAANMDKQLTHEQRETVAGISSIISMFTESLPEDEARAFLNQTYAIIPEEGTRD